MPRRSGAEAGDEFWQSCVSWASEAAILARSDCGMSRNALAVASQASASRIGRSWTQRGGTQSRHRIPNPMSGWQKDLSAAHRQPISGAVPRARFSRALEGKRREFADVKPLQHGLDRIGPMGYHPVFLPTRVPVREKGLTCNGALVVTEVGRTR